MTTTASITSHAQARPIGAGNEWLLDAVLAAYACALDLAERGHTVVGIQCSSRNPIVWIAEPPASSFPHACLVVRVRPPAGRERIMVALHMGCQVQWAARSH